MLNFCYVFVKIQEKAGRDREIRVNISSNAVGSIINKSDPIISCVIARSVSDEAIS
jgi:hypothetical protein